MFFLKYLLLLSICLIGFSFLENEVLGFEPANHKKIAGYSDALFASTGNLLVQNNPAQQFGTTDPTAVDPNLQQTGNGQNQEKTSFDTLPENFQPPMKNVFLNTLFGAITGAMLGFSYGALFSGEFTLSQILQVSTIGAGFGGIGGGLLGIYLSYNNLYFTKSFIPGFNNTLSYAPEFSPLSSDGVTLDLVYRF